MSNNNDMYSINNYTEEECFEILGLDTDPTDDELENAIKNQQSKYAQIPNERGKKLHIFFNDMYDRFFLEEEEEESDDEQINHEIRPYRSNDIYDKNNAFEGFTGQTNEGYSDRATREYKIPRQDENGNPDGEHVYEYDFEVKGNELVLAGETNNIEYDVEKEGEENIDFTISGGTEEGEVRKVVFAESINAYDPNSDKYENYSITKDIEHTPGQLNPLLKQTIKRTIYINSQDRDPVFDDRNALTTDFHFYLEETLRNVVSIKLYAVQIPYTWYTIDSAFGSNFFYLKSDTPGIANKEEHEYKIEIEPGNYNPRGLVDTINTQMTTTLRTDNPDVSFGSTGISYNGVQAKPIITVDIEKVYDASEFEIIMTDSDQDDSYNSIAKYLGFTQIIENITHELVTTSSDNNIESSTGTDISFSIVRYTPTFTVDQKIEEVNTPLTDEEVLCTVNTRGLSSEIITNINNVLQNNDDVNGTIDVSYNDPSYNWTWNIAYERSSGPMRQNQKLALKTFDSNTKDFFGFDSSYTELNPYILYGNDEIQVPMTSDISGVQIILRNNWVRDVMEVSIDNFESTVDLSINIDNSSNEMEIDTLIGYVQSEFNNAIDELTSDSAFTFNLASDENGNVNTIDIDISINHSIDGSSNIFETDSSSGGIVVDFSGFLHDRLFFSTRDTSYNLDNVYYSIYDNNKEGIISILDTTTHLRTKVEIKETSEGTEYIYTSLHPEITKWNYDIPNFKQNTLQIKGKDNFTDFSFNLDFSDFDYSSILNNFNTRLDLSNVIKAQYPELDGVLSITYQSAQYQIDSNNVLMADIRFPVKINDIAFIDVEDLTYQFSADEAVFESKLIIKFFKRFNVEDYKIELRDSENDPDFTGINASNIWTGTLKFSDLSQNLNETNLIGRKSSGKISLSKNFIGIGQTITIKPKIGSTIAGAVPIILNMNEVDKSIDGDKTDTQIIDYINTTLATNDITFGSYFKKTSDNKLKIKLQINKVYTANDYKLVLFDDTDFIKCNASLRHARNTKYDTTLGYILGYRDYTEYNLNHNFSYPNNVITRPESPNFNPIKIKSDAVLSIYIYNTLMIVLEDYNQNHINDKMISVSQRDTKINLQNRKLYTCNPYTTVIQSRNRSLTQNQLYSIDAITAAQTEAKLRKTRTQSLRDVFAVVPIKSGLNPGDIFVEFGGTLQAQERTYFGPVNISRLRVKLVSDKGDVINLNGAHWSFQLICETLYQSETTSS